MNQLVEAFMNDIDSLRSSGLSSRVLDKMKKRTSLDKDYCKFKDKPFGLLFMQPREEDDAAGLEETTTEIIIKWLVQEKNNYRIMRDLKANVPMIHDFFDEPIITLGRSGAAGIVVDHLDELGVYKISSSMSGISELRKELRKFDEEKQILAQNDYKSIRNAILQRSPSDPQVLLTTSGRIYLIDLDVLHEYGTELPELTL